MTPGSIPTGNPTTTITVDGANFVADAMVLWSGQPPPTTFVSASRVTAQVAAAPLATGQVAGIAVPVQAPENTLRSRWPSWWFP
jgi:hypothetical protein